MTDPANHDELTPAQRRTLAALLVSRNPAQAATAANVSERSVRRWLTDPAFAAALRGLEAEAIAHATRRLAGGTQAALDAILDIMQNEDAPPGHRLRAAALWLDAHLRYREIAEFAERLAELEARMEVLGK